MQNFVKRIKSKGGIGFGAFRIGCFIVALLSLGCQPRGQPPLRIAAAAGLLFALPELIAGFEETVDDAPPIDVIFGSSGNLVSQVRQRAPFDLFLSANRSYPEDLVRAGLIDESELFPYAFGRLAIWARTDRGLDVEGRGIAVLADPGIQRVAVANPQHAPYGVAALAAIAQAGLTETVVPRLVKGQNVAQAAQFVDSGSADVGLIALPLAMASAMQARGIYTRIPADAHPPMEQVGVVLPWARYPDVAVAFREYMLSDAGRSILARYGFDLPDERSP